MPITGISVSQHNGDLNFSEINKLPISFMYLRAAYSKNIDAALDKNVHGAMSIKMPFGLYYEVKPQNNWKVQADIHTAIEGDYGNGKMPPVLWLIDDGSLSKADLEGWTFKWIRDMEAASGKKVMVFTSYPFFQLQLPLTDFMWRRLLWLNDKTTPYTPPNEWSNHGKSWSVVMNSSIQGSQIGSVLSKVDSSLFGGSDDNFLKVFGVKPKTFVPLPPSSEPWLKAKTMFNANPRVLPDVTSTDAGTISQGVVLETLGEPVNDFRPLKIWVHNSLLEKA